MKSIKYGFSQSWRTIFDYTGDNTADGVAVLTNLVDVCNHDFRQGRVWATNDVVLRQVQVEVGVGFFKPDISHLGHIGLNADSFGGE